MNVTLKLPSDIIQEARHRAVNQSQSLSAWLTSLVRRELAEGELKKHVSLAEAMQTPDMPDWFYEKDFPLPDRKETKHRAYIFEPSTD